MPLWMSSGDGRGCGDRVGRVDQAEGLARHEAFQAADDLTPGPALGEPTLHVGLGTDVPPQPRYDYAVQGRIGLAVAATIQPAPLRVPRRRLDRADATQSRKEVSLCTRSGLFPATISNVAALSGPIPTRSSRAGRTA